MSYFTRPIFATISTHTFRNSTPKITENTHRTFNFPSILKSHPIKPLVQPKTSFSKPLQSDMSYGKRFALLTMASIKTKPAKTDHSAKKSQTKALPVQKQSPKLDVFNTIIAPLMRTLPTSLPRELPELCTNLPLVLHESEYQAERQENRIQNQAPAFSAVNEAAQQEQRVVLHESEHEAQREENRAEAAYALLQPNTSSFPWRINPLVNEYLTEDHFTFFNQLIPSQPNEPAQERRIVLHESEYQAERQENRIQNQAPAFSAVNEAAQQEQRIVLHESEHEAQRQENRAQAAHALLQPNASSFPWRINPLVNENLAEDHFPFFNQSNEPAQERHIVLHESEYQAERQTAPQRQINSVIEEQSILIEPTSVRTDVPRAQQSALVPAPLVRVIAAEQQRPVAVNEATIVINEEARQAEAPRLPPAAAKTQSLWDKFWSAFNSTDTTYMDAPMYLY